MLCGPRAAPVRDWLHGRGFDDETIRANQLGGDPGRQLLRRRRGLPYGKVPAATFPALDPTGQVTYVQARYLDADAAGRKYDNPAAALAPTPASPSPPPPAPPRWPCCSCAKASPTPSPPPRPATAPSACSAPKPPTHAVAARIASHAEQHRLDVVVMCDANDPGRPPATASPSCSAPSGSIRPSSNHPPTSSTPTAPRSSTSTPGPARPGLVDDLNERPRRRPPRSSRDVDRSTGRSSSVPT